MTDLSIWRQILRPQPLNCFTIAQLSQGPPTWEPESTSLELWPSVHRCTEGSPQLKSRYILNLNSHNTSDKICKKIISITTGTSLFHNKNSNMLKWRLTKIMKVKHYNQCWGSGSKGYASPYCSHNIFHGSGSRTKYKPSSLPQYLPSSLTLNLSPLLPLSTSLAPHPSPLHPHPYPHHHPSFSPPLSLTHRIIKDRMEKHRSLFGFISK